MRQTIKTEKIGPKLWILTAPYKAAPAGTIIDGASVPRPAHNFMCPMSGRHAEGAGLHDYRYSKDDKTEMSRSEADKEFLKEMLENGVLKYRAHIAYMMVRACGFLSYKKKYGYQKLEKAYPDIRQQLIKKARPC